MFRNRVRLPFYLSRAQFPVERNVFRKADGSSKLLSSIIRHTYEGETDQLPEDWHRKLVIALSHDEVAVEDNRLLTDVVLDGDYSIDWQRFLNYPLAKSEFKIQVTPFNATNSNCQSCSEITQLDLVDDTTAEVWEEGSTNEFPVSVLSNDTICCYPFIVEIISYNDDFFDSVTITNEGILTAVVKASVPVLNNVFIATYRVTCENGGYDEANVYGNITGDSTECPPITGLLPIITPDDGTVLGFSWDEPSPAPADGYNWELFESTDLFTPVQSGNVPAGTDNLSLTGLTPNTAYTVVFISDCGESESVPVEYSITTRPSGDPICGSFEITYVPVSSIGLQSYSYIDCDGNVQTAYFSSLGAQTKCMLLQTGTEIPVFFTATTSEITITYIEPC